MCGASLSYILFAASGDTCPMHSPRVPPENRPSVTSATDVPSGMPLSMLVSTSISRMPGPPLGPSLRTMTTSPGEDHALAEPRLSLPPRSRIRGAGPTNVISMLFDRADFDHRSITCE